MNYRYFMYLSLPDPRNSGRRYKQNEGVALYRFPKNGGFIELHEIDNQAYTHKIVLQFKDKKTDILANVLSGQFMMNGTVYNGGKFTSEIDMFNKVSDFVNIFQ